MSTTHHTAITTGAAANAATVNSPLGELDAAIVAADLTSGGDIDGTLGISETTIPTGAKLAVGGGISVTDGAGTPEASLTNQYVAMAYQTTASINTTIAASGSKVISIDSGSGYIKRYTAVLNIDAGVSTDALSSQAGVSITGSVTFYARTAAGGVAILSDDSIIYTSAATAAVTVDTNGIDITITDTSGEDLYLVGTIIVNDYHDNISITVA